MIYTIEIWCPETGGYYEATPQTTIKKARLLARWWAKNEQRKAYNVDILDAIAKGYPWGAWWWIRAKTGRPGRPKLIEKGRAARLSGCIESRQKSKVTILYKSTIKK